MTASVAIVGTGLIGTSVGLALRAGGADVTLYDASDEHVRRAADLGAGRPAATRWGSGEPAREPADVVLLATPPAALAPVLRDAQQRRLGATYTDTGSVKVRPVAEAARLGCNLSVFVGGHPMAGRERSGPGAARADLFTGRPWVLTPGVAAPEHLDRVRALVAACGATPVLLDAPTHDQAVALVSHVPHVLSCLAAARLRDAPQAAVELSGQGVRDVTRVAGSDPQLWTAILTANAGPVAAVLAELRGDLDRLLAALHAVAGAGSAGAPVEGDPAAVVTDVLGAGVEGRRRIPGKHGAPPTTYAVVPVVLADRPGELARLFADAGGAGVNIEDVSIEHSPGQPVGLVELAVRPERADALAAALRARLWTVHR